MQTNGASGLCDDISQYTTYHRSDESYTIHSFSFSFIMIMPKTAANRLIAVHMTIYETKVL